MSQQEITARHHAIMNRLFKSPATLKEINQYLSNESEIQEYKLTVSNRTFQRDRKDILSGYQISIECEKSKNRYYIEDTGHTALNNRILDAFNFVTACRSTTGMNDYMELETHSSSGSENLHGIIHALKNKFQLNITYQSYWDDEAKSRSVQPYLLKEFKNRWYLFALDIEKNSLRTFALDRLKGIDITKKKFSNHLNKDPKSYFKDCFGIIAPETREPLEPVILSFTAYQGNYIKSLPLHHSQEILIDDDTEVRIKLDVYPTFDLAVQILSYGENVVVVAPESLRQDIAERLKQALLKYRINAKRK
jgi:predicted DNA-binding transcriptional regulator YafY